MQVVFHSLRKSREKAVFCIVVTVIESKCLLFYDHIKMPKNTHDPVFNALELFHQYLHAWVLNHIRYSFMRSNVLRGVDLIVSISKVWFWHYFKCGHYKHLWLHPHEKAAERRINHHWPHIFTQPWAKICFSLPPSLQREKNERENYG